MAGEKKAASQLAQASSLITFNSRIFGEYAYQQDKTEVQSMMRAFIGFVDVLAEAYENRTYDVRDQQACELAYHIRNAVHDEYGWKPTLDMI